MLDLGINLSFNGNCREAFQFYEKILDGKINILMTWGESPMAKDVPANWADKITHASMSIGEKEITGGDSPGAHYQRPQGFSVALNLKNMKEAQRIFGTLGEGGSIRMPLAKTFWAEGFGMLTDKFGTPWMINCGK